MDKFQIVVGTTYLFDNKACFVTAVHTTHVNFIARRLLKQDLGRGHLEGAVLEQFTARAVRVPSRDELWQQRVSSVRG